MMEWWDIKINEIGDEILKSLVKFVCEALMYLQTFVDSWGRMNNATNTRTMRDYEECCQKVNKSSISTFMQSQKLLGSSVRDPNLTKKMNFTNVVTTLRACVCVWAKEGVLYPWNKLKELSISATLKIEWIIQWKYIMNNTLSTSLSSMKFFKMDKKSWFASTW